MTGRIIVTAALLALTAWSLPAAAQKLPVAPEVDLGTMEEIAETTFTMGLPAGVPAPYGDPWFMDQTPDREVTLSAYHMDRYEVTVAEFALFLTYAGGEAHYHRDQPIERVERGYLPVTGTEREPMRQVTWQAAAHFCAWAGKRLPTEAEWERAAAGPDQLTFPWGDDGLNCSHASYFTSAAFCEDGPVDVDGRPDGASVDGIEGLAGNVAEWVADWYADRYPVDHETDPTGPESGTYRVVRGGGFLDANLVMRTHTRWGAPPRARSENVGFRCVWSEDEAEEVRRGDLEPAADVGREPRDVNHGPPAPEAETVAEGFVTPFAIVEAAGGWYVADRGTGEVVRIDVDGGELEAVVEGLTFPAGLAFDDSQLYVSDRDANEIWQVDLSSGASSILLDSLESPNMLRHRDGVLYWATADAIWRYDLTGATPAEVLVGDLDGVGGFAVAEEYLYFPERGLAAPENWRVARVALADGTVETLLDASDEGDAVRVADVALRGDSELLLTFSVNSWPRSGGICWIAIDGSGPMRCYDHSPPAPEYLTVVDDIVYWTTRYTLARRDLNDTEGAFAMPGTWTRAGGLFAGPSGVVWADRETGRVYRVPE